MTPREKVILGLTAAAAVGAGIYYTLPSGSKSASAEPVRKDFSALIAKVQVSLAEGALTDREERLLTAATTQWLRDPLRARPLLNQDGESAPLPTYVGYINTGSRPIAIIDGIDYRPGEAIRGGEYQLSQVHPDHIKLLRLGARDTVDVPLEKPQNTGASQ